LSVSPLVEGSFAATSVVSLAATAQKVGSVSSVVGERAIRLANPRSKRKNEARRALYGHKC
jgi:hypothetical protein